MSLLAVHFFIEVVYFSKLCLCRKVLIVFSIVPVVLPPQEFVLYPCWYCRSQKVEKYQGWWIFSDMMLIKKTGQLVFIILIFVVKLGNRFTDGRTDRQTDTFSLLVSFLKMGR